MNKYKMYFLHDPIANSESQITRFNQKELQKAFDEGYIIIGITQDDKREVIKSVVDVVEPQIATMEGITLVLPSYVDSKVDNLATLFEELINKLDAFLPFSLDSLKGSIQQIHNDTIKVIEEDKKLLESSPTITKHEEQT